MSNLRSKMEKLAEQVINNDYYRAGYNGDDNTYPGVYFTEELVNWDESYRGYKYFMCYHNTHSVKAAWKTQEEAVEGLQRMLDEDAEAEKPEA